MSVSEIALCDYSIFDRFGQLRGKVDSHTNANSETHCDTNTNRDPDANPTPAPTATPTPAPTASPTPTATPIASYTPCPLPLDYGLTSSSTNSPEKPGPLKAICHHADGAQSFILCLPPNAYNAHLQHGDTPVPFNCTKAGNQGPCQ